MVTGLPRNWREGAAVISGLGKHHLFNIASFREARACVKLLAASYPEAKAAMLQTK